MKIFKFFKKLFFWSFGIVALIALAAVVLGYFYQDRVHLMAIEELEKELDARIELRETDISFLTSWPNVTVELEGLHVNPKEADPAFELFSVENAALTVDFWSFFSDQYKITKVALDRPNVNLLADKQGNWNYDALMKSEDKTSESTDSSSVRFELEKIEIQQGAFQLLDHKSPMHVQLGQIDLQVKGDLYQKVTHLAGEGNVYVDKWQMDGINYVTKRWVALTTDLQMDFSTGEEFEITSAELQMEKLVLDVTGSVVRVADDYNLNLAFLTNDNTFESFLSLLPANVLDTGHEYAYAGDFKLNGTVKGLLGKTQNPEIYAEYQVRNGSLQYEGYSSRLSEVFMEGIFHMKGNDLTNSYFSIDTLRARLHENELMAHMHLGDFNKPLLDFEVNGAVELADLKDFYPSFADSTDLRGLLLVDLRSRGLIDDYKEQRFSAIKNQGWMETERIYIQDPRIRFPVEELRGKIEFSNDWIAVPRLQGKAGSGDFDLYGRIDQYMPFFFDSTGYMQARVKVKSGNLDLNEWLASDEVAVPVDVGPGETLPLTPYDLSLPQRIDLTADLVIDRFALEDMRAKKVEGKIHWRDDHLDIPRLTLESMEGRALINGEFDFHGTEGLTLNTHVAVDDIQINEALKNFRKWADFTTFEDHLYGRYTGKMHIKGGVDKYLELEEEKLWVDGQATIRDGELYDYEPLEELSLFIKMEKLKDVKFSTVTTTFSIENGDFIFPEIFVEAIDYQFYLEGRHGLFDDSLDYRMKIVMPHLLAKKSKNTEVVDYITLEEEETKESVIPILITGTMDDIHFKLDRKYVKNSIKENIAAEKEEVKIAFQEEVDYLFGEQDTLSVGDFIEIQPDPDGEDKRIIPEAWAEKLKNPFKRKKSMD